MVTVDEMPLLASEVQIYQTTNFTYVRSVGVRDALTNQTLLFYLSDESIAVPNGHVPAHSGILTGVLLQRSESHNPNLWIRAGKNRSLFVEGLFPKQS